MDKVAPYSFNYQPVYEDKRIGKGRKKITAITFTPVFHSKNRDEQLETKVLQKQVSLYWTLSKETISYLKNTFHFKTEELKRNMDLLKEAEQKLNLTKELILLKEKALKADNTNFFIQKTYVKRLEIMKKLCKLWFIIVMFLSVNARKETFGIVNKITFMFDGEKIYAKIARRKYGFLEENTIVFWYYVELKVMDNDLKD